MEISFTTLVMLCIVGFGVLVYILCLHLTTRRVIDDSSEALLQQVRFELADCKAEFEAELKQVIMTGNSSSDETVLEFHEWTKHCLPPKDRRYILAYSAEFSLVGKYDFLLNEYTPSPCRKKAYWAALPEFILPKDATGGGGNDEKMLNKQIMRPNEI